METLPGKGSRGRISLTRLLKRFPDDASAEAWFEKQIWPDGPRCPHCGTGNVQCGIKHKTMTHRCRECPSRPFFSLRKGTIMQSSKLGYQVWAVAIHQMTTQLEGVSSMKLHRDVEVTQKTAWHMAHRLRKSIEGQGSPFADPVEVGETHAGGKRKNRNNAKRKALQEAGTVRGTDGKTLKGFAADSAQCDSTVYTDDTACNGLPREHKTASHSVSEHIKGQTHINGAEPGWSMLKNGYQSTCHHLGEKHMDRHINEFAGRHKIGEADTLSQMDVMGREMAGRKLTCNQLRG